MEGLFKLAGLLITITISPYLMGQLYTVDNRGFSDGWADGTSIANATSYQSHLEPLGAGAISGSVVGTAEWSQDYTGLITQIYVQVENDYCETVYLETLEVGLSPVGVTNPEGMELDITVSLLSYLLYNLF
ncbi:MAG: hypothetical protein QM503_12865 [Bacteroidota bacterium]